jgi:hypothetical protein
MAAVRSAVGVAVIAVAVCATVASSARIADTFSARDLPALPGKPDLSLIFFDARLLDFTITEQWEKIRVQATAYAVETDATLWRKMHFEDWDTVPRPIRERGLSRMAQRYRSFVEGGAPRWEKLEAVDWDAVPQPVRAMAFVRMARFWSAAYPTGRAYGLDSQLLDDTLPAILLAESWFEHRAAHTNADTTSDLGLGGCSEFCRNTLRRLQRAGRIDFAADDDAFTNPWVAIRAAAIWFSLMIVEADGNLDRAIAAYHAGIGRASSASAVDYARDVVRKRQRFVRNVASPPSWRILARALLPGPRWGPSPRDLAAAADVERQESSRPFGRRGAKWAPPSNGDPLGVTGSFLPGCKSTRSARDRPSAASSDQEIPERHPAPTPCLRRGDPPGYSGPARARRATGRFGWSRTRYSPSTRRAGSGAGPLRRPVTCPLLWSGKCGSAPTGR